MSRPLEWNGPCSRCAAVAWGTWPHPEGEPCPLILEEHEREQRRRDAANAAYVAQLEAERDYYERMQMPGLDAGEMYRTITKALKGQDD